MSASDPAVAVVGGGPAGLIAAETLAGAGVSVAVYDRMPTFGRKFLMAGRGGLNLTHSEHFESFVGRYGDAAARLRPMLEAFPPKALVAWAEGLGQPTFVGSSGRIFPKALKASPLLRAWLARLESLGVVLNPRHEWLGWAEDDALRFRTGGDMVVVRPQATILALGGSSYARLGSDGGWADLLARRGIPIVPFQAANCGFTVGWSEPFRARFAGTPLKTIALSFAGRTVRGEAMIAGYGIEGGAVYGLSAALRDAISDHGQAVLGIDLHPDLSLAEVTARLTKPRKGQSASTFLRKALDLPAVAVNLLREAGGVELPTAPAELAALIKRTSVTLVGTQAIDRAISTAGGVDLTAVDDDLMLRALPGVYVAGEMLDWEAPTGGYLLQASFATGVAAARAVSRRL